MINKVRATAKNFKNALHGDITLVNAVKYAGDIGYNVVFFKSLDDKYLNMYGLVPVAQKTTSFTYSKMAHIIFVDDNLPHGSKLHRLLHELGHILLGHIGNGQIHLLNQDETESEAEAFVCEILYKKSKSQTWLICIAAFIIVFAIGFFAGHNIHNSSNGDATVTQTDIVYVTPAGQKYHRAGCIYTKGKDCTALSRSEAEKNYSPCAVCQP